MDKTVFFRDLNASDYLDEITDLILERDEVETSAEKIEVNHRLYGVYFELHQKMLRALPDYVSGCKTAGISPEPEATEIEKFISALETAMNKYLPK